ncbi:MAG: protein-L-isoaspartate O-methyltransferase [Sphingomonadaceae bacterium]
MASAQFADIHARARDAMIDSQLKPCGIGDPQLLAAFAHVPREDFLDAGRRGLAYVDCEHPVGEGRAMMAPLTLARLLQAADVIPGERVLVIGGLTGYSAALLADMGAAVTMVECDPRLVAAARERLAGWPDVTVVEGPLETGAPDAGPFDLILLDGAVEALPASLAGQLRDGGRAVLVLAGADGVHRAAVCLPTAGTFSCDFVAEAPAPLLPAFRKPRRFQF